MSKVILPRISSIIKERQDSINKDFNQSQSLKRQIEELQTEAKRITDQAEKNYRDSIDKSVKKAAALKEDYIEKLKQDSQKSLDKSQKKINEIVTGSENERLQLVEKLSVLIHKKVTN